jgi:hypothetical protein
MTKKFNKSVEQLLITRHDWIMYDEARRSWDRTAEIEAYKVGEFYLQHVAAPGTGYYKYVVTKITPVGLYGKLIESTVRDLETWEVY